MINNYFNHIFFLILLLLAALLVWAVNKRLRKRQDEKQKIDETLSMAGYAYDPRQDIFFSMIDAWQKNFGYNQIYDEAAAALSMIIDCEPIKFRYEGKKWLIQLWKGQYGMTTGAEIGIYTSTGPNLEVPGVADGTLYDCASEEDQLYMAFILRKNGRILFKREGWHWWLTGFVLGEFSEPDELDMEIIITLKDKDMCRAFVKALQEVGYSTDSMRVFYNTVWLIFGKPFSPQPLTRTPVTDALTQKKNQALCERYQELTKGYSNSLEKLTYLWRNAPELFESVMSMGKPTKLLKR